MREVFEEIREQIHEIRNLIGPFDLKLSNLDHQITVSRVLFEERTAALETRVSLKLGQQDVKIADILAGHEQLSERINRLELTLNVPEKPGKGKTAPAHEDKTSPDLLPPQRPVS